MNPLRRKITFIAAGAVVLPLLARPASASEASSSFNGKSLLEACQAFLKLSPQVTKKKYPVKIEPEHMGAAYCSGIVQGVASSMGWAEGAIGDGAPTVLAMFACVPDDLDTMHLAAAIVRYVQAHPKALTKADGVVVIQAFREAWPCAKGE